MKNRTLLHFALYSIALNLLWAYVSTQLEYSISPDRENPQGIITAGGFILIYTLSFFVFLPATKKTSASFIAFFIGFAVTFLVATFGVPLIFVGIFETVPYLVDFVSSLVTSLAIVSIVRIFYSLNRKWLPVALTTIVAFGAAMLFFNFYPVEEFDRNDFKRIIHPLAAGYCLWQILTTITIGQAIDFEKAV